jgi:hypothetical protein
MRNFSNGTWLWSSLIAGLVAAVVVEVYLVAVGMTVWPGTFQFVASAAIGERAFSAEAYAWLGAALHLGISLGWGVLFGLAAVRWPALIERPVRWGLLYGFGVLAAMQGVMFLSGVWAPMTALPLTHYIVDHVFFFGVPLALTYRYVSRRLEETPHTMATAATAR